MVKLFDVDGKIDGEFRQFLRRWAIYVGIMICVATDIFAFGVWLGAKIGNVPAAILVGGTSLAVGVFVVMWSFGKK